MTKILKKEEITMEILEAILCICLVGKILAVNVIEMVLMLFLAI